MAKITTGEGVGLLSRQARARRRFLMSAIAGFDLPVVEVGALNDPVFRREEGEVWFADYFTRAESAERLQGHPHHPPERMVDVDFVLRDRSLLEAVTTQSGLTIANHVIEHLPDPIRWLQEARKVTRPDGFLFMAVPDRRYTFDDFKPTSDAVDWIAAYDAKATRPTRYHILRGLYYHADLRGEAAWAGNIPSDHMHRISMADAIVMSAQLAETYTDTHCWVFTQETFLKLLTDLEGTGLIPWTVTHTESVTQGSNEFRVLLRAT